MSHIRVHTGSFTAFILIATFFTPATVFAYQAAPLANTKGPTYITEKSARLNGAVNPNEVPDNYIWFEWGIAGRDQVYQTQHRNYNGGNQPYDVSEDIHGLAPNVQYFYRLVSENGRGKDIGQTAYFTTKLIINPVDPLVIVNTNETTAIADTSAMLHAYIAPHGSQGVQYWFEWGATNKLENETPHYGWGADSGNAQIGLSGLTSGSVYFYRIVARNGLGLVYGGTRVFTTTGLPPPPPETIKSQNVSGAQASDGVTRNVTTSGTSNGSAVAGTGAFPNYNLFAFLGGNKSTANTQPAAKPAANTSNNTTGNTPSKTTATGNTSGAAASTNAAALGASNPVGSFWNTLTGKKVVEVHIEKIGPTKVPEHTPIEYRISYSYRVNSAATNAKLKIILPASVVYIGDNTNNELLLEESAPGTERTYVLPVGRLESGSVRTISILGITTSDAGGVFPDARARLEYTDSVGSSNVIASVSGSTASAGSTDSSSSSGWSIIPSTFLGWLLYVLLTVGAIFAIRKGKAFYQKRKEEIALEEEAERREAQRGFPSSQVHV